MVQYIREATRQLIATRQSEYLKTEIWSGGGISSGRISSAVKIVGLPPAHYMCDEDNGFCYLPSYCFDIEVERTLMTPAGLHACGRTSSRSYLNCAIDAELPNNKPCCLLLKKSGEPPAMCVSSDSGSAQLTLDDFFAMIDGERNGGNRFFPFTIEGDPGAIAETKTEFCVRLKLYAEDGHYRINSVIREANPDIESLVFDLIKAFATNTEIYRELKPHYRHTDENGKRLWSDSNLQSRKFYAVQDRLHQRFMRKIEGVFNAHHVPFEKEYGLGASLRGLGWTMKRFGVVHGTYMCAASLWYRLTHRRGQE